MKEYGGINLVGNKWVLSSLEPHVSIKLKNLFPGIPKYQTPPFEFSNTSEACADLSWFIDRYRLTISEEDLAELQRSKDLFYTNQTEMEAILTPGYTPRDYALKDGQTLRVYQAQAIEVFKKNKQLLCGDNVGLGKSYVGIGAVLDKEQLPAVIVVQTHLSRQWKEKIEEFSHLRVHLIKGTRPYSLPEADVYIMKYSCLSGWTDIFQQRFFKSVVADECQDLRRGVDSDKGKAAKILTANTEYQLFLTATPIYNYGDEIWNILDIMKEGCLGKKDEFMREWGDGLRTITDPKALGTYLREKHLFLRRTREDVGQYLQPVNKIVETVGYDELAVKSIEELATKLAIKASRGTFVERGMAARELDMMVRQATGISKAKFVAEFVKILLENDEPVLLAGWHREVYSIWLRELADYNPVMYTGSESEAQKEKSKNAFINGDSNLMFISLRSGVGLDGIQKRCSTVVFGELDWSPGIHYQVAGRLDREGQQKQVMAIYLVSDSGSDPLIVDLLGLKSSQAQGIVDPSLGIQAVHSDTSRFQMLVQAYLKKAGIKPEPFPVPDQKNKEIPGEGQVQLSFVQ